MTTGGLLLTGLGMSNAHADTTATGDTTQSPGVGSGNLLQLPINAPINVCGNQLDVVGILDSVTGNSCVNHGGGSTAASGASTGSPGVGSGNLIQVPVNAPVNICGNQFDVIGIGNTDRDNSCVNHGGGGSTTASGGSSHSPGIVAGNVVQVPIDAPVNICGNNLGVVSVLNSVIGNSCANSGHGDTPPRPNPSPTPTPTPTGTSCGCTRPPAVTSSPSADGGGWSGGGGGSNGGGSGGRGRHGGSGVGNDGGSSGKPTGVLAHTGSGALAATPFAAGLVGGGVLLRRRFSGRSH